MLEKKAEKIPTLRDLKVAWGKLNDFRNRMEIPFVHVHGADIDSDTDFNKLLSERSEEQERLSQEGTDLLRAVGNQFSKDNGVEPGSGQPESVTDETELSAEARGKLQKLLNFLVENKA